MKLLSFSAECRGIWSGTMVITMALFWLWDSVVDKVSTENELGSLALFLSLGCTGLEVALQSVGYNSVSQTFESFLDQCMLKNWCFWTVVSEKTFESPLDCKEIQSVHYKGYQSWVFIGRTDAEAEAPILWPPDVKSWLIGKYPDAGRDWGQEKKGTTKDEMAGWHQRLDGHEFE